MSKIDELNVAVSNLNGVAGQVLVKIQELKDAGGANDGALEAATASINDAVSKLSDAIA